jgi:putative copper resistance protein D
MLLVVTSILVFLSSAAWLSLEAGEMGNGPMDALRPEAILAVLSGTTFGHVWQFHLAASLALVIAIAMRPAGPRRNGVLLFLAALLLASQSWVGHAIIERGMAGVFHLASQTIHLTASATWLGGLLPLGYVLRQACRCKDGRLSDITLGIVLRYSNISLIAVVLIILSGLVNSWFLVGNVDSLITTLYGRVLIIKLVLFITMLGTGAYNRFVLLPRLDSEVYRLPSLAALLRTVTVEQGLGLSVLAIVSVLGILPPAIIGP